MKQTHCYVVVYIKTRGTPALSVHLNKQHALKELADFNKRYEEDPMLYQIYVDCYMQVVVLE